MEAEAIKWRVHIGVHKTATTHLQDIAEMQRDKLYAKGVDFIPRIDFRKQKILGHPGVLNWRSKCNDGKPLLNLFDKRIKALKKSKSTIVLSEENFLGSSFGLLRPVFYSTPSIHMQTLALLSMRDDVSIFLSIRPQVSIIPSAYFQIVRAKQFKNGFNDIRKEIIANPPSWLSLLRYIKKTIPNADLSIWTMEDYLANKNAVLSHFFGVEFPIFEDIQAPSKTKSPSAEAIQLIDALTPNLPKKVYRKEVNKIIQEDQGTTKFSPFSDAERLILTEQYNTDILTIKKEFPGVILEL